MDWSIVAALVQAVGSVVAILVAIWVPYDMDKKARFRQEILGNRKQRQTQIWLLPTLYEIRSKTNDFIEEHSGKPSFLGIQRESSSFDSDFFSMVPKIIEILRFAPETGSIDLSLNKLAIELFKIKELLNQNNKLQRDGYHAAWLNHRDLFIESAQSMSDLADFVIGYIEKND